MTRRRRIWSATRFRRVVQIAFLLLFFALLVCTCPSPGDAPRAVLKSFFYFDPLILLATWLAAHAVPPAVLLALVVIAVTLVMGRVFCGWVCPLGTIHDVTGRFFDRWRRHPRRRDRWSPWQRVKYYLLVGLLVMAVFGGHWVTIFDPLVLLYRTTTTALLPGCQWAVEQSTTAVYQSDLGVGHLRLTVVTEPAYEFLRDHVFGGVDRRQRAFMGTGLIIVVFAALLALNGYRRRFWCRYLCPLGALLGLFAWRPILWRTVRTESCNQCGLCGMACHGAAAEEQPDRWKPSECFVCLNCTQWCPPDVGLGFHFRWAWRRPAGTRLGLSRRAALGAAVGGLVALAAFRSNPLARGKRYNRRLIRPPGARPEREFLQRCTACGLCMKACPTGALQPAVTEAGLEGLWTPKLVPRIGWCEYGCNLCGHVCPTEAIEPLSVEAKQQIKIGLASFDTTRCIPYAYGRNCMVCEEHCPVPDKAIYVLEVEIEDRDGQKKVIKQPHVDPDLCTGCGICENVCPFKDGPAIRVSSANETRNPGNQPVLPADDLDFYY